MDILTATLAILSVVGAIILKLLSSEIEAWLPKIACLLIDWAVAKSPEHERERRREEWIADNNQFPGKLAKLWHAFGCVIASFEMPEVENETLSDIVATEEQRRRWLLLFEAFLEYRMTSTSNKVENLNYSDELSARIEYYAAKYGCSPATFVEALRDLIFVHENNIPITDLIEPPATSALPPPDPRSPSQPT